VRNSSVERVSRFGEAGSTVAFRDRGDSPWDPSPTAERGVTYPFADKSWSVPDPRRASHNTIFENISVIDAPNMVGVVIQESLGTQVRGLNVTRSLAGFQVIRPENGRDTGFLLQNFEFSQIGIPQLIYLYGVNPAEVPPGAARNILSGVRIANCTGNWPAGGRIRLRNTGIVELHNLFTAGNPNVPAEVEVREVAQAPIITFADAGQDSDNDKSADCADACPKDPQQQISGICGCGATDTDADFDGLPDCLQYRCTLAED